MRCFLYALLFAGLMTPAVVADDWPQWMGPERDGVWRESGVVSELPADGAPVKWRAKVSYGYSAPSVSDGKVFLFDYVLESGEINNLPSRRDKLTGAERLTCYDAATGEVLWQEQYDRSYAVSYGGGPRCAPTVDGDHVYTLGAEGDLVCRKVANGSLVWQVDFKEAFGSKTPVWGHSAHPLVAGDTIYCVAGGKESVAVALDKNTGDTKWQALTANSQGYCPPTWINHGGVDQLLIWHPESLNSLNPATGEVYWDLPARPSFGMSIMAPQKLADKLFISGIGNISVMMKLTDDRPGVDVLWAGNAKKGLRAANVTPLLVPGVIFGVDCETSELMAVSMTDGKRLWKTKEPTIGKQRGRHGTVFLVRHEPTSNYFLFGEQGDLISAKLTAEGYEETGRQHVLEPTSSTSGRPVVWTHPAFAERCFFARNDEELVCVSLAE